MEKEIINQILPLVIAFIVAILTYFIKVLGMAIISFIEKKESLLEHQIGKEKFERELSIGKTIWNLVEENFRVKVIKGETRNKIDMFNEEIHKVVPYLTESEIDNIRQAIGGEINLGKQDLIDGNLQSKTNILKEENSNLKSENNQLQKRIEDFSKAISELYINPIEENRSSIKSNFSHME